MSPKLYKYLPYQLAHAFLSNGEAWFRSLSYFIACEQMHRGDDLEGTRVYAPSVGLEIRKNSGERLNGLGWSFRSSMKALDEIFVYCTSTVLSADLAREFESDACVEIADIEKFVARLRTAARRRPRVKLETLRQGHVTCYCTDQPPEEVWALPDLIVMHKPQRFAYQCEYRFVISKRADAYDFENVNLTLVRGEVGKLPIVKHEAAPLKLKLGDMSDCCRVHRL